MGIILENHMVVTTSSVKYFENDYRTSLSPYLTIQQYELLMSQINNWIKTYDRLPRNKRYIMIAITIIVVVYTIFFATFGLNVIVLFAFILTSILLALYSQMKLQQAENYFELGLMEFLKVRINPKTFPKLVWVLKVQMVVNTSHSWSRRNTSAGNIWNYIIGKGKRYILVTQTPVYNPSAGITSLAPEGEMPTTTCDFTDEENPSINFSLTQSTLTTEESSFYISTPSYPEPTFRNIKQVVTGESSSSRQLNNNNNTNQSNLQQIDGYRVTQSNDYYSSSDDDDDEYNLRSSTKYNQSFKRQQQISREEFEEYYFEADGVGDDDDDSGGVVGGVYQQHASSSGARHRSLLPPLQGMDSFAADSSIVEFYETQPTSPSSAQK